MTITPRPGFKVAAGCARLLLLACLLLSSFAGEADDKGTVPGAGDAISLPTDIGEPNDGKMTRKPGVEKLSADKFRVGAITIDKSARLMTVPGRMLPYEEGKPIEYIATMRHGFKAYESVITLDADAFEFNIACILIGLDPDNGAAADYHFDPEPVEGDRVSIRVRWQQDQRWIEVDAVELLSVRGEKPAAPSQWSYTGSGFIDGDRYLAQMYGVLIGLIHDPATIIEHRQGIGLGDWGSIGIDPETAPAGGHEIQLQIRALD